MVTDSYLNLKSSSEFSNNKNKHGNTTRKTTITITATRTTSQNKILGLATWKKINQKNLPPREKKP